MAKTIGAAQPGAIKVTLDNGDDEEKVAELTRTEANVRPVEAEFNAAGDYVDIVIANEGQYDVKAVVSGSFADLGTKPQDELVLKESPEVTFAARKKTSISLQAKQGLLKRLKRDGRKVVRLAVDIRIIRSQMGPLSDQRFLSVKLPQSEEA